MGEYDGKQKDQLSRLIISSEPRNKQLTSFVDGRPHKNNLLKVVQRQKEVGSYKIVKNNTNFRDENHIIIQKLPINKQVEVIDKGEKDSSFKIFLRNKEHSWVNCDGVEGWVVDSNLSRLSIDSVNQENPVSSEAILPLNSSDSQNPENSESMLPLIIPYLSEIELFIEFMKYRYGNKDDFCYFLDEFRAKITEYYKCEYDLRKIGNGELPGSDSLVDKINNWKKLKEPNYPISDMGRTLNNVKEEIYKNAKNCGLDIDNSYLRFRLSYIISFIASNTHSSTIINTPSQGSELTGFNVSDIHSKPWL